MNALVSYMTLTPRLSEFIVLNDYTVVWHTSQYLLGLLALQMHNITQGIEVRLLNYNKGLIFNPSASSVPSMCENYM